MKNTSTKNEYQCHYHVNNSHLFSQPHIFQKNFGTSPDNTESLKYTFNHDGDSSEHAVSNVESPFQHDQPLKKTFELNLKNESSPRINVMCNDVICPHIETPPMASYGCRVHGKISNIGQSLYSIDMQFMEGHGDSFKQCMLDFEQGAVDFFATNPSIQNTVLGSYSSHTTKETIRQGSLCKLVRTNEFGVEFFKAYMSKKCTIIYDKNGKQIPPEMWNSVKGQMYVRAVLEIKPMWIMPMSQTYGFMMVVKKLIYYKIE